MSRSESRGGTMRFIWPGFLILMGHFVDVIEWFTIVLAPNWAGGHYLTHSVFGTCLFLILICIGMLVATRLRKPWPYALIAVAFLSHLALDALWGRSALANLYGIEPSEDGEGFPLRYTFVAEIWLYGMLLLIVMLGRGASEKSCPKPGRIAAGFLGALAILAVGTRIGALWMPIYALGFLHAALLLRRRIDPRLLWSLIPLLPIVVYVGAEIHSSNMIYAAESMRVSGDFAGALTMFHRALRFPMHASHETTFIHIAQCHDSRGELADAEMYFKKAVQAAEAPGWGRYWLAWFYAKRDWRDTPYFRPRESARILEQLLRDTDRPRVKQSAQWLLGELQSRGDLTRQPS